MRLIILIILACLAGCVSSAATYGPDGKMAHTVTCSGTLGSWAGCYQRAGEICGSHGYTVVGQADENGYVASRDYASNTRNRSMMIQCK